MNNKLNPIEIVTRVLDIIGYDGDKEKYANKLVSKCMMKTVDSLAAKLPEDKQKEIVDILDSESDNLKGWLFLLSQFDKEELSAKFKSVCQEVFFDLAKALEPTLTDTMKAELTTYSKTLTQPSS